MRHFSTVWILLFSMGCTTGGIEQLLNAPIANQTVPEEKPINKGLNFIEVIQPTLDDTLTMGETFQFEAGVIDNPLDDVEVEYVQFEISSGAETTILGFKSTPNFVIPINLPESGNRTLRCIAKFSDGTSLFDEITLYVNAPNIINNAPVANNDAFNIAQDTILTLTHNNVLLNDTDPEDDVLLVATVQNFVNGSAVKSANSIVFTPNAGFYGNASFEYTVSDGMLTDTAKVNITVTQVVQNLPPVANPDNFTVNQDTPLSIPVASLLSNDMDPNGNTISVTQVSNPVNGTVVKNGNNVTFTPNAGFYGNASFRYTISDGSLTANATVSITVNQVIQNQRPNAVNDTYSTNQNTALTKNSAMGLLANDNDPENSILTVVSTTTPTNGSVSFNSNGSFTYTPTSNFTGNATFQYTISDGMATDSALVTITVSVAPSGNQTMSFDDGTAMGVPVNISNIGPQDNLGCPNQNTNNHIYIDTNANSNGSGTYSSPYNTISSLSGSNIFAGKTVCFKRGTQIRGTWYINFSGSSSNPVKITSYGSNSLPSPQFVRGVDLTGWTQHSGNVYKTQVPNGLDVDKLLFDGVLQIQARHPNIGSPTVFRQANPSSALKVNNLSSVLAPNNSLNLVGAQAVTKVTNWSYLVMNITAHNGDLLNYSIPTGAGDYYYTDWANTMDDTWLYPWGIYFRNKLQFLDSAGEWHFDAQNRTLYFWAPGNINPNGKQVEIMERDKETNDLSSIVIGDQSHITLENLDFRSAPRASVVVYKYSGNSTGVTIKNCRFKHTQRAVRNYQTTNFTMNHNLIEDIYFEGIHSFDGLGGDLYHDNLIQRVGVGMPDKHMNYSTQTALGMKISANKNVPGTGGYTIRNNILKNIGYIGMMINNGGLVENNIIDTAVSTFNDGGNIYFERVSYNAQLIIRNNLILRANGNLQGTHPDNHHYVNLAQGIYFGQEGISDVQVYNNTIYKISGKGIVMDHSITEINSNSWGVGRNYDVRDNIIFGAKEGIYHSDYSTWTFPQAVIGNPTLAGSGWTNCDYYTRHMPGKCFQPNYNDKVENNIIYKNSNEQIFRKFMYVYSDGQTSNQSYPNKSVTTGYYKRTNFFGSVNGVQGSSNNNIYFNPFQSGTWGNAECGLAFNVSNGCGSNDISFNHWKNGYELQDRQSHEFFGLASTSSISASQRGKLYFNNTDSAQTFSVNSACDYKLEIQPNGAPQMEPTGNTITVPPRSSMIIERDC